METTSYCACYIAPDGALQVVYEVMGPAEKASRQEITLPPEAVLGVAQSCLSAMQFQQNLEKSRGQSQEA